MMFKKILILMSVATISATAYASTDACNDSRAEDAAKQAKSELESADGFSARPEVTAIGIGTCKTYFFEDALGLDSPFDVRSDVCGVKVDVKSKAGIKSFGRWLKTETKGSFFIGRHKNVSVCADVTGEIDPQ